MFEKEVSKTPQSKKKLDLESLSFCCRMLRGLFVVSLRTNAQSSKTICSLEGNIWAAIINPQQVCPQTHRKVMVTRTTFQPSILK